MSPRPSRAFRPRRSSRRHSGRWAESGTKEADAAAGRLARQLVDGDHFEVDFGVLFPDAGLTIDGIFAFASAKASGTNGAAAIAWLAEPANL